MMILMKIGDTSFLIACTAHEFGIICKYPGTREIHLHHFMLPKEIFRDHALLKLWSLHVGTFGSKGMHASLNISGRLSEVGRQVFFMTSPCLCIG
jgi:hypothetical protein